MVHNKKPISGIMNKYGSMHHAYLALSINNDIRMVYRRGPRLGTTLTGHTVEGRTPVSVIYIHILQNDGLIP